MFRAFNQLLEKLIERILRNTLRKAIMEVLAELDSRECSTKRDCEGSYLSEHSSDKTQQICENTTDDIRTIQESHKDLINNIRSLSRKMDNLNAKLDNLFGLSHQYFCIHDRSIKDLSRHIKRANDGVCSVKSKWTDLSQL